MPVRSLLFIRSSSVSGEEKIILLDTEKSFTGYSTSKWSTYVKEETLPLQ